MFLALCPAVSELSANTRSAAPNQGVSSFYFSQGLRQHQVSHLWQPYVLSCMNYPLPEPRPQEAISVF